MKKSFSIILTWFIVLAFYFPRLSAAFNVNQKNITPDLAVVFASNSVKKTENGYHLAHKKYAVDFTPHGIQFSPKNGPNWTWVPKARSKGHSIPEFHLDRIIYQRQGYEEQYVLRQNSIEQQFLLPHFTGKDVMIEGLVLSDGVMTPTSQGWKWSHSTGSVYLKDVRVFDATGSDIPAEMKVTATSTRIIVKADQLANATYPVTIDPEIGTNDMRISDLGPDGNINYDAFYPSVAYNSTNNEYLVVWFGDDNTGTLVDGETEVFGQRIDAATGAELGTNDFRISDMGPDGNTAYNIFSVDVVYNSTNNEYLVVWYGEDNTGSLVDNELEIFGQRINAATGAEVGTNDFRISDMGSTDGDVNYRGVLPRVAYNAKNNEYLVVWSGDDDTGALGDNEFEIYGQRLNAATGAELGTNDFRISDMGANDGDANFDANAPKVAYNFINNEYLVVWTGDDDSSGFVDSEFEIFGQRLDAATGAEVGTNDFRISDMGAVDGSDTFRAIDPDVAYNSENNEYLVVWRGDDDTGSLVDGELEIFGQRLNAATGAEVGFNDFRISDAGPDGDTTYLVSSNLAVHYNSINNDYLVIWSGNDNTPPLVAFEFEIHGQRIDAATGAEIGDNDFSISDMGSTDGDLAYFATTNALTHNTTDNEYFVVWTGDDDVGALVNDEEEIFGQRLDNLTVNSGVGSSIANVQIYPNPFNPGVGGSRIIFRNLPSGAKINIYTLTGQEIYNLTANDQGRATWDGKNSGGSNVASGVYFVHFEGGGSDTVKKIAIQR